MRRDLALDFAGGTGPRNGQEERHRPYLPLHFFRTCASHAVEIIPITLPCSMVGAAAPARICAKSVQVIAAAQPYFLCSTSMIIVLASVLACTAPSRVWKVVPTPIEMSALTRCFLSLPRIYSLPPPLRYVAAMCRSAASRRARWNAEDGEEDNARHPRSMR